MALPNKERRSTPRVRLSCLVRLRPSTLGPADFDKVLATENTSRGGLYVTTDVAAYWEKMRVFVTVPFSAVHGAINREYLGQVARVDELPGERKGLAIRFLTTLFLSVAGALPDDARRPLPQHLPRVVKWESPDQACINEAAKDPRVKSGRLYWPSSFYRMR